MLQSEQIYQLAASSQTLRVGYVLKRFPRLTETFVLNELLELERQGVHVEVYSLLAPRDEPRHALLSQLKARVHYLSDYLPSIEDNNRESCNGKSATSGANTESLAGAVALADLMPGKTAVDVGRLVEKSILLARLGEAHGVQHLHAHFGSDATTAALLAGTLFKRPYSFTAHAKDIYHNYVSPEADHQMRSLKLRGARFVVTVSEFNRKHLMEIGGGSDFCNVVRLYNGIDLELFKPRPDVQRESNHLVCVGRLVEKKGIGDLIAACGVLSEKRTDFKCTIIGDGPLRDEFQSAIRRTGLDDIIHLAGTMTQDEVLSVMRRATMMILPCVIAKSGDRDGLPTVLLEAIGCGLPAISTRVAGIPEIIEDGKTGLLTEPGKPVELAAAIARLLDDPQARTVFAAAGRRKAISEFCLKANVTQLRRMFELSAKDYMASCEPNKDRSYAHRIH